MNICCLRGFDKMILGRFVCHDGRLLVAMDCPFITWIKKKGDIFKRCPQGSTAPMTLGDHIVIHPIGYHDHFVKISEIKVVPPNASWFEIVPSLEPNYPGLFNLRRQLDEADDIAERDHRLFTLFTDNDGIDDMIYDQRLDDLFLKRPPAKILEELDKINMESLMPTHAPSENSNISRNFNDNAREMLPSISSPMNEATIETSNAFTLNINRDGEKVYLSFANSERTGLLVNRDGNKVSAQVTNDAVGLLVSTKRTKVILPGRDSRPFKKHKIFILISLKINNVDREKSAYCLALLGDNLRFKLQYTPEGFKKIVEALRASLCQGLDFNLLFFDSASRKTPSSLKNFAQIRYSFLRSRINSLPLEAKIREELHLSPACFDSELANAVEEMLALEFIPYTEHHALLARLTQNVTNVTKDLRVLIAFFRQHEPFINHHPPIVLGPEVVKVNNPIMYIASLLSHDMNDLGPLIQKFILYYRQQELYLLHLKELKRQLQQAINSKNT